MPMGVDRGEDALDGSSVLHRVNFEDELNSSNNSNGVEATKMADSVSLPCMKNIHRTNSPNFRSSDKSTVHIPATVDQIAKDLAFDIVYHISRVKKRKASSNHSETLRRTVGEMSHKHEILFNGMVKKLEIGPENAFIIFTNVANEIFKDKQYNWGRVVSLYAFGARMARHVAETNPDQKGALKTVDKIARFVGEYVSRELGVWIHNQGGWDAFDEHFPEQLNIENAVWKGLLVTAFGLGALATIAAVR